MIRPILSILETPSSELTGQHRQAHLLLHILRTYTLVVSPSVACANFPAQMRLLAIGLHVPGLPNDVGSIISKLEGPLPSLSRTARHFLLCAFCQPQTNTT